MFEEPLPGDDLRGPPRPFLMYDGIPVICDLSFCERGLERASDRVLITLCVRHEPRVRKFSGSSGGGGREARDRPPPPPPFL